MKNVKDKTMKAVAIDHFGGSEEMRVQTLDVPKAGPDEILIHVEMAGIGVWDPFECEGGFAKLFGGNPKFPYVPGSEGAGTVEDVGQQVKQFKKGDRVYGIGLFSQKGGFYAEYAVIKAEHAAHIPENLSAQQAGVLAVDGITALTGLDEILHLKRDESLLIFGASGGIGHLAVQLAKRMRARVFAIASGADGVALVERLGADRVVDGHKGGILEAAHEFAPKGFDAALLTAGGKKAQEALECMRKNGRVAFPNGVDPVPQATSDVIIKSYDGVPSKKLFDKLNSLVELGPFQVHIAKTFSLEQIAEAHRALKKHFIGKYGIKPK